MTTETPPNQNVAQVASAILPFIFSKMARGTPSAEMKKLAQVTYAKQVKGAGLDPKALGLVPRAMAKLNLATQQPKAEGRGKEWIFGLVCSATRGAKTRGKPTAGKRAAAVRARTSTR